MLLGAKERFIVSGCMCYFRLVLQSFGEIFIALLVFLYGLCYNLRIPDFIGHPEKEMWMHET